MNKSNKAKDFVMNRVYAIFPVQSLADGEIYAPQFEDGEKLVFFKFPLASISEIPIFKVNNKNAEAKKMLGNAPDVVGINVHIADKIGADLYGDSAVIIPMKSASEKGRMI